MKFIIVIKGVIRAEYTDISRDIAEQFKLKGWSIPIFAYLPAEYPEIEIVWINEETERENFLATLRQYSKDIESSDSEIATCGKYRAMILRLLEDGAEYKLSQTIRNKAYDLLDEIFKDENPE